MSDWALYVNNLTMVAVADGANFTDSGYMAIQGPGAATLMKLKRWSVSGLAAVTSAMQAVIARDSTVGATLTALVTPNSNGPMNSKAQALSASPGGFIASTTKPQRSNSITQAKYNIALNAYGGIYDEDLERYNILIFGQAATDGEMSLSAIGGTIGAVSAHCFYEPL